MAVVSVSLPDDLVARLDALRETGRFQGRSELVRAALRAFLQQVDEEAAAAPRAATLTLLYPEGQERRIGEVRHEFTDIVRSMMHGHAGGSCVEVFVLEGEPRRIRGFADALRALRDARLVHLVATPVGDAGHG